MNLLFWRERKSEPTEVLCYPLKDAVDIHFINKESRELNTTSPLMKESFKELVKWFTKENTPIYSLSHDNGVFVFKRDTILYIDYRVGITKLRLRDMQ